MLLLTLLQREVGFWQHLAGVGPWSCHEPSCSPSKTFLWARFGCDGYGHTPEIIVPI